MAIIADYMDKSGCHVLVDDDVRASLTEDERQARIAHIHEVGQRILYNYAKRLYEQQQAEQSRESTI